jgi:hypothetical protein
MKNYGNLLLGLATLFSSAYAAEKTTKNVAAKRGKSTVVSNHTSNNKTTNKKTNADEFKLGKIVALSQDGLRKKHGFTHLDKMPSWDFGYGAPVWLTKTGAKVIVPRSNGQYTYGIVLKFQRPTITILVDQKADGSYETKEFRVDKLSPLKWIHKSWITKKRGAVLMDKEKAFVNYNHVTKNFDPLAL